ncbi:acyl carrier protein [Kribbella sindirgiensis]|uniref:acyl carrier protein n=1 Tax=Kribbella sindirgiensis TaxID=1124744 RepID=UPI0013F45596|nr:acyl carrier protein [Kribbella sindirgiensis]
MESNAGDYTLDDFLAELASVVECVKSQTYDIGAATPIAQLGLDSLEMLEVLVMIEQRCSTTLIGDPGLVRATTSEDLYRLAQLNRTNDEPSSRPVAYSQVGRPGE